MNIIQLTSYGNRVLIIPINKIVAVLESKDSSKTYSEVYVSDSEEPFLVDEKVDTIRKMLEYEDN